jgi:hypothetical protein
VEPAPAYVPPLEVTVIDRPTGRARTELRQPWQAKEEITSGEKTERNITLVWGYGSKKTQPDLMKVVTGVSHQIREKLKSDPRFARVIFDEYADDQKHATIIGMEVVRVSGRPVNLNFLRNNGVQRPVYPRLLLDLLASAAASRADNPLLTVRFGGWGKAHCQCTEQADLLAWACRTGTSPFHGYKRTAYEGSFYISRNGQVVTTAWAVNGTDKTNDSRFAHDLHRFRAAAEHAGYLDGYHRADKPEWRDDDFFIRLGTLKDCSDDLKRDLEEHVRSHLATQEPVFVQVRLADMRIVYYEDTSLAKVIKAVPISDTIKDPGPVDALYQQWLNDNP